MSAFKIIMDVCFVASLLLCADSDRRIHEIPGLFLWGIALPGLLQFGYALGARQTVWPYLCAAPLLAVLLVFWHRGFIGGGDVKLMALICLYMGIVPALVGFTVAALILGMACAYGAVFKKDGVHRQVPLAPSLALGCIGTIAAQYISSIV